MFTHSWRLCHVHVSRVSHMFIPTTKHVPKEAAASETSHKLMLRAGFIHQVQCVWINKGYSHRLGYMHYCPWHTAQWTS
jgi:hypothetical protein